MQGFKQCPNGHYFKEDLSACPYCPKSGDNNKTQVLGTAPTIPSETVAQTMLSGDGMKTQIFGGSSSSSSSSGAKADKDLNRTFIQVPEEVGEGDSAKKVVSPRAVKRIVGWIISYTLDPMGMDFRIFEGNNTIGRAHENTITIVQDQGVSAKHVTILYKKGKFYIKDEMTPNGTFLNNDELEIGHPYELKDGDEIKLGHTTIFRFKSAE